MSSSWAMVKSISSRLVRPLLLIAVPAVVVLIGFYVYARGGREMETENAYVKANVMAVSSEVSGRVIEVNVRDDQPVAAGARHIKIGQCLPQHLIERQPGIRDVRRVDAVSEPAHK